MKYLIVLVVIVCSSFIVHAQKYPEPEFSKEVYWLKKDSGLKVIRLEKGSSKMETKTKLGGMGGSETSYNLEGTKSTAHVTNYKNLSFVFSTGASSSSSSSSNERDSMMRANGMDPSVMQGMPDISGMNDPSTNIILYKLEITNGKRKVLLQKNPGMSPFGSKKQKSSDKYAFSVKKIRDGYWELVIDKTLPRGEYAFVMAGMGMQNMNGDTTLFSFGVD
jgi:hypothetical protein